MAPYPNGRMAASCDGRFHGFEMDRATAFDLVSGILALSPLRRARSADCRWLYYSCARQADQLTKPVLGPCYGLQQLT